MHLRNLWQSEWAVAAGLFLLVFVTHSASPIATSSDSYWTVPQLLSLLFEGNLELSEYKVDSGSPHARGLNCVEPDFRVNTRLDQHGCSPQARFYGHYPFAPVFFGLVPMVALDGALRVLSIQAPQSAPDVIQNFLHRDYLHSYGVVEVVLASFLIGIATAFVFLTGREFLSRRMAVVLALLFAYGTAAWSTGSRAMWQHTPEMLLLAVALYLLVAKGGEFVTWSALPLSLAYFVRPTAALVIAGIGAFIFLQHRRRFVRWSLLGVLTAAPFVVLNFALYRRPLQPYFTEQRFLSASLDSAGPFFEALAGNLVSPSRGLFIFSPVLLFAIVGVAFAVRQRWQVPLVYFLSVILLLHWVAISAFADWTAGSSFGPRYFSDMTPILVFLLIPVLARFSNFGAAKAVFVLAAALSVAVHFRGAVNWEVHQWNDPGVSPARVWDWSDPQFLRGLLHK